MKKNELPTLFILALPKNNVGESVKGKGFHIGWFLVGENLCDNRPFEDSCPEVTGAFSKAMGGCHRVGNTSIEFIKTFGSPSSFVLSSSSSFA